MTTRYLYPAVLLLLFGAIAIAASRPVLDVSEHAADRIRAGMTLLEVEGIIVGSPGVYDGIEAWSGGVRVESDRETVLSWISSNGEIAVWPSEGGVGRCRFAEISVKQQSHLARFVERLTRGGLRTRGE
jgi:hypothetical protein